MSPKKRVVIGVTGNLGSGKSTVAKIFAGFGAKVFDADEIVKDVYRRYPNITKRIVTIFGKEVLDKDGRINKKTLSQKAFVNKNNCAKLNKVVHPQVIRILIKAISKLKGVIIIDAALLIESGFYRFVDFIVLVKCPLGLELQRAAKNSRLSEAAIRRRLACQLSFKNKKRYADFIINNGGSIATLKAQVKKVYSEVAK